MNPDSTLAVTNTCPKDGVHLWALMPAGRFIEIFVQADVETCRARDPKELYAKASAGRLDQFTGVSAPYEEPTAAELTIDTRTMTADAAADMVINFLRGQRLIDV